MTETLDRLDLELRCLPGVLAVGIAGSEGGETVVVQVVITAEHASSEVRDHIRRITRAHVDRPLVLEVIVDGPLGSARNGPAEPADEGG